MGRPHIKEVIKVGQWGVIHGCVDRIRAGVGRLGVGPGGLRSSLHLLTAWLLANTKIKEFFVDIMQGQQIELASYNSHTINIQCNKPISSDKGHGV